MVSNLWFFYALGAALTWGLGYVLAEKLMAQGLSPAYLMMAEMVIALPFYVLLAWKMGTIGPGLEVTFSSWKIGALMVVCALLVIGGNFLILTSIAGKNATLAALIEISYPIFTFIFAWLIFKDVQLNWATAIGGLLIMAGIATVYLKG